MMNFDSETAASAIAEQTLQHIAFLKLTESQVQ